MKLMPLNLDGVVRIEPDVHTDARGYFMETYHSDRYARAGLRREFVQDNLSFSVGGTLRGLHYQIRSPQAKLVQVVAGEIFDVAVDIRPGSVTFGNWVAVRLSDRNNHQLFIPEGFAHGFYVLSQSALVSYKCSDVYNPGDEGGILWSDPHIGIDWPAGERIISAKDRSFPPLRGLRPEKLPAGVVSP